MKCARIQKYFLRIQIKITSLNYPEDLFRTDWEPRRHLQ
jgi:hypothetical protein